MPKMRCGETTATVTVNEISFEVSHVRLADIAELKREHVVHFLDTLDAYKPMLLQPEAFQRSYGLLSVLIEMHEAVAHLIEISARGACTREEARQLPLATQLQALIDIASLSMPGAALGKAWSDIVEMLKSIEPLVPQDIN